MFGAEDLWWFRMIDKNIWYDSNDDSVWNDFYLLHAESTRFCVLRFCPRTSPSENAWSNRVTATQTANHFGHQQKSWKAYGKICIKWLSFLPKASRGVPFRQTAQRGTLLWICIEQLLEHKDHTLGIWHCMAFPHCRSGVNLILLASMHSQTGKTLESLAPWTPRRRAGAFTFLMHEQRDRRV